ncbi:tenascin-X-like isoform X2 [Eriocheir sinensis]|uniref:tenascin-X-like isoform X2 n=1 Tax=Eriocheir sinensis TaxID=95602 RepID=UPI0021C77614|nr:tenascin-X-like isoform X2 [Eriocheir sinensis]
MKFIMNWDQPQGPFRRAYTCHRPRHEGKDDKTSGNSRKRNSSTQACVENGCECMCVSGCLTCCRCPSAGCVCSCLVVAPAVAKDIVSRATLCPDLCADCGHCQESNWVSWPGCRQWMQSRGKLQCPGLCAAWQVMQLRFCAAFCRTLSGEQLGALAWEKTGDIVSRATLCPGLCADCGHCQESNWVSWPGCRQWMQSRGKLQCPGLCAAWQVMQLRFCAAFCRTLSGEQLGALAWEKTGDFVSRATLCPGLCADCGHCQESNWVSWPGCRQWMQSRGKLQCPGLCAAWQVMQLRFCGHSQETSLGILACVEALVSEELREFF